MSEPFMEHPDGTFDRATDAIADAVKRLRELPAWDEWITFCAQGYGGQPDTYRLAEIKLRRDKIASELHHCHPVQSTSTSLDPPPPLSLRSWTSYFASTWAFSPSPTKEMIMLLEQSGSEKPLQSDDMTVANKTLEPNCRPASPLDAWRQFGRTVHAQPCVSGGSRSALR
jgi:hypothetical protein